MPQPINLDERLDMETIVCPNCREPGTLRLHVRGVKVAGVKYPALVPEYLKCTRSQKCGYWRPLVSEG